LKRKVTMVLWIVGWITSHTIAYQRKEGRTGLFKMIEEEEHKAVWLANYVS
jgi:hypothetical protein